MSDCIGSKRAMLLLAQAGGEKHTAFGDENGAFSNLRKLLGRAVGEEEEACEAGAATAATAEPRVECREPVSASAQESEWVAKWIDVATGIVLIVGDGNLSFSLALARAFPRMRLIATTYDSEQFVRERYGAGIKKQKNAIIVAFENTLNTYISIYVCTYVYTNMHACMHTCIHAYMHTCIHAYMHTQTQ